MNEFQTFTSPEFGQIRTVEEEGKIFFCGKDVAVALGFKDTAKAIKQHCRADGWANYPVMDSLGRIQQAKFITEPNLYRLITHSKLPSAERFERWVFEEILPSIRRTGGYTLDPVVLSARELTTDDYIEAARIVAHCRNSRLPIVLDLLKKGGFPVREPERLPAEPDVPDIVISYLSDRVDGLVNVPTNDVYAEYKEFCETNEVQPVSNIVFTKYVNRAAGTSVIQKKVDGVNRRVFVSRLI